VLDNCEHLVDACATAVDHLATIRGPLQQHREFEVKPGRVDGGPSGPSAAAWLSGGSRPEALDRAAEVST
jgi:predicted ATPase